MPSEDGGRGLGGGAINEKQRQQIVGDGDGSAESSFEPSSNKSHLWHALEGLDRYPNYLSRWSFEDVDRLEDALESKLRYVREQRQSIEARRSGLERLWKRLLQQQADWQLFASPPDSWEAVREILAPETANAIFKSKQFVKEP